MMDRTKSNGVEAVTTGLGKAVSAALTRRALLKRSAAIALSAPVFASLLAACAADDDDEPDAAAEPDDDVDDVPDEEPDDDEPADDVDEDIVEGEPGGELIVAAGVDNYVREGPRTTIGMYVPNTNIFDTLVRMAHDYELEPMLAESWEFVEPNTWRFDLREDVTFHDGTPFTAEAVAWTMARTAEAGGGLVYVAEDSTEVIDDHTVEITPSEPNLRLPQQIVHAGHSIFAPDTDPEIERVGTGPFREVEYVAEDRYVVEAFEDHWGGPPSLQRITFRFMPDPTTRVLALQAGDVDLVVEVAREAAESLEATDGFSIVTSDVGAYSALYLSLRAEEPFHLTNDREVREAIAHAVDKESIVEGVWRGNAEVSNTMIPPGALGDSAGLVEGVPYDPDRAREILEDAGWVEGDDGIRERDGERLRVTLINGYPSAEVHGPMPEFVQSQLREVGIDVEIVQTPDSATYSGRLGPGEGNLWAEAGSQNDANPTFLPEHLFLTPTEDTPEWMAEYGRMFAPGEEADEYIAAGREAVSLEEAQEAAANVMRILIDEEFAVVPIAGTYRLYGISDRVQGFVAHPSAVSQRWSEITIAG